MADDENRRLRDCIDRMQAMTGMLSSEISSTLDRLHRTYQDKSIPPAELKLWRLRLDTWHSALTNYANVAALVTPPEGKQFLDDYMASVNRWLDACKPDDEDVGAK
jgi:hypothetical protein